MFYNEVYLPKRPKYYLKLKLVIFLGKWLYTRSQTELGASLVAQRLKHLPAMWGTQVRSLGWEDSPGEGNSNPLQYSCLENPMDRGVWQAIVHGVTKGRT